MVLSLNSNSPKELSLQIALRIRDLRLEQGWSREELAARSGVASPTLRKFEDTGQISLERLLKLAHALGVINEFARLAVDNRPVRSLDELQELNTKANRKRGRTLHAGEDKR